MNFQTLLKTGGAGTILFGILILSSCWLSHFQDFHKILLKSNNWLPAAFQRSSVQIQEIYQPLGRGNLCKNLSIHYHKKGWVFKKNNELAGGPWPKQRLFNNTTSSPFWCHIPLPVRVASFFPYTLDFCLLTRESWIILWIVQNTYTLVIFRLLVDCARLGRCSYVCF